VRDDLLLYYERELDYLRKSAAQFAEKNPKVASRLVIEPTKCEDPHVERLLEAFAFLAARVHLKMDDDFPEISESLLTVVYPQLVRPLPSMSVIQFQPDQDEGKLTTGLKVTRESTLYSKPVSGVPCTFRTCYDTTLWPINVTAAEWKVPSKLQPAVKTNDSAWAVRIELRCAPDVNFQDLKIDTLRFYLDGESGFVNILYELLFTKVTRMVVRDLTAGSKLMPVILPASLIQPVGFADDEGMIPNAPRTFVGHRLLMEYFAFPEKFLFIDLTGLERVWAAGFKNAVELIFLISDLENDERIQRLELEISQKTFRLGCTPIVNLFTQIAEPVQVNQRKYEYPVTPDIRRPQSMEVFSIDEVAGMDTSNQQITTFQPFYSLRHSASKKDQSCYWLAKRRPSTRPNDTGTDVFVSIVDLATRLIDPGASVLSIRTTCTNRDLPSRLPFGNQERDFELESPSGVGRIVALRKPTSTVRPDMGRGALWKLISHLSLNYISLVEEGKEALQEILRIHDVGRTAYSRNVIDSIVRIQSKRHFTRLSSDEGTSFVRGTLVEIEIDENQFAGGGAYLFASVLERFLGISASLNSFTQLVVTTPQRKILV
jgi:type VI secretion system protein ImpG